MELTSEKKIIMQQKTKHNRASIYSAALYRAELAELNDTTSV
jgi:hypothetical protein